jgi:branched-chain amino acid transport system substrate-binding protein
MKMCIVVTMIAFCAMSAPASTQVPVKVGVIVELTGAQAEYGLQMTNGMKLYMHEQGAVVGGRAIELVIRDVGGAKPEVAKRLAQELIIQDKVDFLAGFGFTPNAAAVASIATEAKLPTIIMNAASSDLTVRSPYFVRTSMTIAQNAMGIASWAAKNGIKTVFVLYADYSPGKDAARQFNKTFTSQGGEIVGEVAVPLQNNEFAPYMRRIKDAKPDATFVWFPSGESANGLVREYGRAGLDKAGIKLISTSDAVDDMFLNAMGDTAVGFVTAGHYSAAHVSAKNKSFVKGYADLFGTNIRPNFMAVGGYDGMAAIYEVVKRLNGKLNSDEAMEVLRGLTLESPRGPIAIDPETRDIVQTVYIRRVERRGSELYNVEFAKIDNVKDPGKEDK